MSRVALVTGGGSRVGRTLSLGLAEAGYDVVVNYRSSSRAAEEVCDRVRALGRECVVVRGDVAVRADVETIAASVRTSFGRLDLLVNNASIFPSKPLLEVSDEDWDEVMGVNLKGPFMLVRALADVLTRSLGSVVNIIDLSAFQAWTDHPHHSVSKAGLLQLTRVMARSLAPEVRVNAVAPGAVLPPDDTSEEALERLRESAALKRLGSPEDVLRTVLFLADSPFITGQVVVVDGGRLL